MEKVNFWQRNFVEPLKWVFSRFPLSIAVFTILAGILSYLVIAEIEPENNLFVFLFTIGLSGILFATARLFQEKFAPKNTTWMYGVILAYLIAFYFFGTMFWERNFPLFLLQTLAFVGFPFWISENWREKTDFRYYNFFRSALTAVTLGAGVAIIMGFLGTIAIFAITELFDLGYDFQGKTTAIWWIFSIVIFGTTYALSRFPIFSLTEGKNFEIDRTSNFVIKCIFVPFSIIYFVILYAYSVKVLANFSDWPKGIIASLVMGFSILGYFTYMLAQNIENNFIKNFRKILPWAVFFQLFMLFYAIWLRIDQYGLTTNRYIIVLSGATLAVISLYFIISKSRKIAIIPASFSLVALLFSVGPWNIQAFPEKLQFDDFIKNIETLGLYKNNEFIGKIDIETTNTELINTLHSKLEYLCNHENNCEQVKKYFSKNSEFEAFANSQEGIYPWQIRQFLQNKMNIKYHYDKWSVFPEPTVDENGYKRLYINNTDTSDFINTRGYDYVIWLNSGNSFMSQIDTNFIWKPTIRGEKLGEFDMKPFFQNILKNSETRKIEYNLSETIQKMPDFIIENEDFEIRLKISGFPIDYKNDEDFYFGDSYIYGTLLIKDKNNLLDTDK